MNKNNFKIILASQSPQRRLLMETLGLEFDIIPANLDEQAIQEPDLKLRAEKVARAKAKAVAKTHPQAIVIAADTYSVFQGQALEKPADKVEAKEMLQLQSGQNLATYTGFCYLDGQNDIDHSQTIETKFKFRDLSETEIDHYIKNEPVTTWSAGFSPAYHSGAALIESMTGSLTSFSHGLPMEEVVKMLRKSGVQV